MLREISWTNNLTILSRAKSWEHLYTYECPIKRPFILLTVLVEPTGEDHIPPGHVEVIKNDPRPRKPEFDPDVELDIVHLCGWCGIVVDIDGSELSPEEKRRSVSILYKYGYDSVNQVDGYCCKDKDNISFNTLDKTGL